MRKTLLGFFLISFAVTTLTAAKSAAETLSIDDPATLLRLENAGLDLPRWLFGADKLVSNNGTLVLNSKYKSFVADLSSELDAIAKKDRSLSTSMSSTHRLFNKAWLTSSKIHFELVGIVNRLDRKPFADQFCGEVRFIYRLAYNTGGSKPIYSRLPMTINASFFQKSVDGKCQQAAKTWQTALGKLESPERDFGIDRLKSIEVNLQAVRWPSTVRPDMGGYAEYLMKVFELKGDQLVASTLENTPDVERLKAEPRFKSELHEWLLRPDVQQAIDLGIAVLPEKFLAKKAVSVALAGSHRLANAPYSRLFSEADFEKLDFKSLRSIKSSHGLIRRLNDLSCVGCHQGRTVAGFHFLGRDRLETSSVNAIHVASSPHFLADRSRREAYFDAVANDRKPNLFRDFSVRGTEDKGLTGAHCGLGDKTFQNWTCAAGHSCVSLVQDDKVSRTGVCMPLQSRSGSACVSGKITHNENSHRDRIQLRAATNCGAERHCEQVSVGFPGGMCSGGCSDLKDGETCGSIAILDQFNSCLRRGTDSFSDCLKNNVRPGALQECSETKLCRDDFICARLASGGGGCIPPYFLFQLRVDGHPRQSI